MFALRHRAKPIPPSAAVNRFDIIAAVGVRRFSVGETVLGARTAAGGGGQ
jgi:hypothetical protein